MRVSMLQAAGHGGGSGCGGVWFQYPKRWAQHSKAPWGLTVHSGEWGGGTSDLIVWMEKLILR